MCVYNIHCRKSKGNGINSILVAGGPDKRRFDSNDADRKSLRFLGGWLQQLMRTTTGLFSFLTRYHPSNGEKEKGGWVSVGRLICRKTLVSRPLLQSP
jgi:hypothetical protein